MLLPPFGAVLCSWRISMVTLTIRLHASSSAVPIFLGNSVSHWTPQSANTSSSSMTSASALLGMWGTAYLYSNCPSQSAVFPELILGLTHMFIRPESSRSLVKSNITAFPTIRKHDTKLILTFFSGIGTQWFAMRTRKDKNVCFRQH